MFKTKKEVDAHVRTALSKIRTEGERHLRSLTIAKLYFKINEYASAEQYVTSYLSVKQDNDQAHKLLGQCYQRLKQPDKALKAYQLSLELNQKQSDVLAEVCQLLLDDKHFNSSNAKYWCELAESEKVQHEAVFSLRLKLMNKDHLATNQVEELLQKEISARPNDVRLRVRLVRNYIEKNQILDAFKYVYQLEMSHKYEFATSSEWYNIVWLVLNKYEKLPNTKKDWDFWLLVAICLDHQVQISFTSTISSHVVGGGVTETANLLFTMDQYLFKIAQLSDKLCAQKELVELFLDHYRGQLLVHATALIFKRELLQNKNKWKETTRAVLPLLLLAYQIAAPENKEPWMKHCDEQGKQLIGIWEKEGSFRCAQMGRTLLSCINDDTSVDKENTHNINYLMGSQSNNLWQNNDELLAQVRQTCSDRQWRQNIFALLFCNSDQKVKEQSSLFTKSPKLSEPKYELPVYADVERYENAAQYLRPQSLQHMVYLCLGNDNLAYVRAKYFSGLNYSVNNLSFCGAESLNQLDVDSFLYAATLQSKRALEVDREAFDNYQSGNSSAYGKPRILPFVNLLNILCSEEQSQWWNAVYIVYKNLSNGGNLSELRATLQYGIEAVRGINGPKIDMAIVFKLGQLFVARAQDIVKPIEKTFLEARAESIYKYGLNMLKMHNKGVLEPFRKYFKYYKSQSSAAERELSAAAEDAVSYLAMRYFKKSEYEDLIDELTGIQLPFATYLQAEAYRKLDEASKTPKKTKRLYLDRANECLNQTLALLKSSAHADPNHPLNSVIHSEIKRLQQASSRYLNDTNITFKSPTGPNHSSSYEDAESDIFAEIEASPFLNSSRNRRETLTHANAALVATHNQELELLIKHVTETLKLELGNVTKEISSVKEKFSNIETLKQEMSNVTKEISDLKEKISNMEDTVKKIRISSNAPSRDDASNVLDDLYLFEDTLQQQLYQPPSSAPPHLANQQYGNNTGNTSSPFLTQQQRLQHAAAAAAFNPMFPPAHNFPMNFYAHANQPNPYIMAPPPPPAAINQRAAGLHTLPYLDPTVPPSAGHNFNMPVTSTSLLPPAPGQPQPQPSQAVLPVEANKPSNLYNLLQQITPNINNPAPAAIVNLSSTPLTHTSITMSIPTSKTNRLNIIDPRTNMPIKFTQPVEKMAPANVVITNSDPLPNPNAIAAHAQQQIPLSVTIPSHHIKSSLVSQPVDVATPFSTTFSSSIATSTFSFKPQIAAAAAQANNTSLSGSGNDTFNRTSESSAADDVEYDPRPDFKPIIPLPDEIEVRTGEEDEQVMFCHRAKLFRHVDKEWKERGIGDIKILKNKEGHSRILMRRDQTHKICANHVITPELILTVPKNETKGFIWAANDFADESLHVEKFFVRFKLPETAQQFQDAFKKAQKEAKDKSAETEKQKSETASTVAPFSLTKSNATNFATSTPAQKFDISSLNVNVKNIFAQPFSTAPTYNVTNTTTATMVSKSLFSGLNMTTKTSVSSNETSNKAISSTTTTTIAAPSPFANFSFSKLLEPTSSGGQTATVTKTTITTNTSSPFASIFSNLSNSTTTNAFIPTTVQEATNLSVGNKSTVSDAEDDYVPTAQFNPVIPLPDLVEVNTGEENELVLFEHRAKLLRFDKEAGEWKERGLGNIKLLQDKDDINKVRLVMRREQIHKLCCNQRVYKDTSFSYAKNSETALSWAGQDFSENELVTEMLTVRFKLPEICKKFLEAVQKAQSKMTNDGNEANSKEIEKKPETAEIEVVKGFGEAFKPKAGSWSCEACYISNDGQQLYCVACNTPKDNTVPKKENNANVLATSTANKFSFGFSTTDKTANSSEPAAIATGFGDAFKPKAGSWSCKGCYVSNTGEAVYCQACEAPKDDTVPKKDVNTTILAPSNPTQKFSFGFNAAANTTTTTVPPKTSEVKAPATIGFGDAFKPKAGSWSCQACYLSNVANVIYCTACDAPKDDTVPKKEATANILALSDPSQKFSFGFGTTTTTVLAAPNDPNKSSSGFSFNATDSAKSFSFMPPSTTSTTLNTNSSNVMTIIPTATTTSGSSAIGKSSFTFSLSSSAMEASSLPGAGGESTLNSASLDKKEFSFTLKPKSPGKAGKSPMRFGGGGDADAAAEADDGEADYHEEEENNTYFTPVIPLPDKIDVKTGEEDEELLYMHRAKLYRYTDGEWKERGLGNIKILRHKKNRKLRVVMRREQVLKICLNHVLNEDIEYKRKDDKSWLFVVNDFSEGAVELEKFSLRFKTKEVAEEFINTIQNALSGTAEVIECPATNTVKTPTSVQGAITQDVVISDEVMKLADKLKLPHGFFEAKTMNCSGCRGCDPDKFKFSDDKNIESFINKEDKENQLMVMELPALTLKKSVAANRSLLKQSTLSETSIKGETTKANESLFSGFGGANSTAFATPTTMEKPINAFSFTAGINSTTSESAQEANPFSSAGQGGFLFGSASEALDTKTAASIFGTENQTLFCQKLAFFEEAASDGKNTTTDLADKNAYIFGSGSGNATTTLDSTENTTKTSIFGIGAGTTSTSSGSIFGGKPAFGSGISAFGTSASSNENNKTMFGNVGSKSIFGSSTNSGFGGVDSSNTQGSIFGSSYQFGSLAKDASTTNPNKNSTFSDLSKSANTAIEFASLAKANVDTDESQAVFDLSKTSTAAVDFASLAKANSQTTAINTNEKSGSGDFIGLTHTKDFLNFQKPHNTTNSSLTKSNKSIDGESAGGGGGGGNGNDDDNYDPHYEPIIPLPDKIVVTTGEEEEDILFGERAKLYRWDDNTKEWKERGVGVLKLLYHPTKDTYRLILRREQIYKVVLNHAVDGDFIFSKMKNDPKSFVYACLNYAESNEGELEKLAIRFSKLDIAEDFNRKLLDYVHKCKESEKYLNRSY